MTANKSAHVAPHRPSGTVTFLFTDIEDSTKLWERQRSLMQAAFSRQEAILRQGTAANSGYAYKMIGDAFQIAFPTAPQALQAALDAQRALHAEKWGEIGEIRVRMALHSGVTEERGDDYVGPALNRAARLMSAGHGGQVLLSEVTSGLVREQLPHGVTLRDMGEHRLKDLTQPERIFQVVADGIPSEFPPLRTLDNRPNNLPVQSTTLVGREKELATVHERLLRPDVRLLTLTGVGGIGKTRLGLQAAADLLEEFPDGIFFVNLAPVIDPDMVIPTIAYTLGLRESGGEPIGDLLKEYLKEKRLLLVLDNFEQVVESAPGVAELIKSAPQLKVLVTSRAALRLSMEQEYQVQPLQVPDPKAMASLSLESFSQYEAVELFIRRAEAVKSDFEVNNQNAPAVAEICYRLEGIPLAIELAAARIKALPPQALVAKLGSRLKLLTGGARDLPSRQQTLRNTIEWSYDLLTEAEKQLFRRMAVFKGGCTLEAAEAVCDGGDRELGKSSSQTAIANPLSLSPLEIEVLDGITSLVDKSLMYATEGASGQGEARYLMLETINEYAWEKLEESGETEALRRAHAHFFMELGEEAEPELTGANQQEWLERLEEEHDNIRAALRWAKQNAGLDGTESDITHSASSVLHSTEIGLRLAGAIWRFWVVRGYFSEGREQLTELLGLEAAQPGQAGGKGFATLPTPLGALTLRPYVAKALGGAGALNQILGDYATARPLHEESLRIQRELGNKRGVSIALNSLGNLAYEQGDYAASRALHEQSLAIRRELGDVRGIAISLTNLGNVAFEQGEYASARALFEEGLVMARQIGDKWNVSTMLTNLGNASQAQGDYAFAQAMHEESLELGRELGDKWGVAVALTNLGNVASEQGDYATARLRHEESLATKRGMGDKRGTAVSLTNLGNIALAQWEYGNARSLLIEALKLQLEVGDRWGLASSLAGLGRLAVIGADYIEGTKAKEGRQNGVERGARLLGAVEGLLETMGASMDAGDRVLYERAAASARAELGEEGFKSAWDEGRAMSVEQAGEYALEKFQDDD